MKNAKPKTKVLVAMSGGVDSSVAAALLRNAGFQVAGAFMKCWDEQDNFGRCTTAEDSAMARRVAAKLNIPFYVFDFTREYRERVFDYFIAEYKAGRTPNPDVVCNTFIKFGMFLEKARQLGFEYIATGHYVRLKSQISNLKTQNHISKVKTYKLLRAKDKNKDQSYFLWQLGQEQLRHCLFPIGDYSKPKVREVARKFGLPNAERKDSQGICFVGRVSLAEFLSHYIPPREGYIVDGEGKVLGRHSGAAYYTIGQRHGIGLAGGPWRVVGKDTQKNLLVVTRNEKDLERKEIAVKDVNWISQEQPFLPLRVTAAIRYRQEPEPAVVRKNSRRNFYTVTFSRPQIAVAPGQSVVFWRRNELLGGGIICRAN